MKIVSGMRPTGRLHLGHYLGVIRNWLELQEQNECYFFVADWHALSTSYEDKLNLSELSRELIKDWLAAGIDPTRSTMFVQSAIKEHSELYLLLNMITPVGWLERNPTYKDQLEQLSSKDINMAGFLTYPVLQAADIILYDANEVPIGEDQRPHLEIAREIVRRFHHLFDEEEVFTEPEESLSPVPKLLGLDGRKMSKSYNNAIYLTDSSDEVMQKLRGAKTDPQRVRKDDPGDPEVCLVYDYHKAFSSDEVINEVAEGCRTAGIGCFACKQKCHSAIEAVLEPMRERRLGLSEEAIDAVMETGNAKASAIAKTKMEAVNRAIFNKGKS
jgi:tryptophanyl-tRNA synthetase